MKVGDLVELSSKGNRTVWCRKFKKRTGIVVDVAARDKRLHTIQVMWMGKGSWWMHRDYVKTVSRG
jgi:hypothetical protein